MATDRSTIIGIDTGGTFTDFVYVRSGRIHVLKVLSTPENPGDAVIEGLERILGGHTFDYSVTHGSTVATNALLERKGASTALITTRGFRDLLEIGRQNRPSIYDLNTDRPVPLVPASLRFEITERTDNKGKILQEVDRVELDGLPEKLRKRRVGSVAVCFLHSYVNSANEDEAAAVLRKAGFAVSPSAEILPEYREFERLSTTVVNAYVAPKMDSYIDSLQQRLPGRNLRIMKSNGGIISADTARKESVHTILSGPAGGVVGAFAVAKQAGYPKCITFDMGGTSTDVSLCSGRIVTTSESSIAGSPIRVPVIDIHTVGAGGGSLVSLDIGGALKVGPESAGADPGPVCYGKGSRLAVTDANMALGRLHEDYFLGGSMKVYPERMTKTLEKTADSYGMKPEELAAGMIRIVNSNMEKALRVISIAKGYNPSDFALVSFGGAGALHAADLARTLNIHTVVIPANPGIYSAMGMLYSDFIKDYSQTVLISAEQGNFEVIEQKYKPLEVKAVDEMKLEGIPGSRIVIQKTADVRYKGQSYELTVPFNEQYVREFHRAHEQRYGYSDKGRQAEVVNVRIRCTGKTRHPRIRMPADGQQLSAEPAQLGRREVFDGSGFTESAVYLRDKLLPGMCFDGPAVVHEYSATTYVPPDFTVEVDRSGNMLLKR